MMPPNVGAQNRDAALSRYPTARHHLHLFGHPREPAVAHGDETASHPPTCSPPARSLAGSVLGKGYAAGMGMTISVFGRVAGREAAECKN
jgi:hypothetical protein